MQLSHHNIQNKSMSFNSIQLSAGLLTDGRGKKAPLPKICHTYPTIMKLGTVMPYLGRNQKI